jgi:hypothetical protein
MLGPVGISQTSDFEWKLYETAGRLIKANDTWEDDEGWTHFVNQEEEALILSIYTEGQEVGDINQRFSINTGLLSNYGNGANDLSGADYIEQGIWLTMNRYWRINQPDPLRKKVRVRFYFAEQDFQDIRKGLSNTNASLSTIDSIQFFVLEGGSAHPFTTRTQGTKATYRPLKAPTLGTWNGLNYVEFSTKDLNSSGSGGFFIPLEGQQYTLSGKIIHPDGSPIEDIYIESPLAGAAVRSTSDGEYILANLEAGNTYNIVPFSQDRPNERVTVLDLLGLQKAVTAEIELKTVDQWIAADANQSGNISSSDLDFLRAIILGDQPQFNNGTSWQFYPADHTFEIPENPFYGGLPASREIKNLAKDQNDLDFIGVKLGDVWSEEDFPNEPPTLLDPRFKIGTASSCGGGEPVQLPFRVEKFAGFRGFQLSIQWDPAVLAFDSVSHYNLPYFDSTCIGTAHADEGRISFAWYTPDAPESIKIPDDDLLCMLHFRAIGPKGSSTRIYFDERPTPLQILHDNLSRANALFSIGEVEIQGETTMQVEDINVVAPSCFSSRDGQIDLTIGGGNPPYQYKWSTGETGPTLSGLATGKYQVTIYDQSECPMVSDTIQVQAPDVLFFHSHNIRQIQCPGSNDGAISFKVGGGTPPYDFVWSNGSTTQWVGMLGEGNYTVTVTDANQCQKIESFQIKRPREVYLNYAITPASDPNSKDGAIDIRDLVGSTPPQYYEWSSGDKGPHAKKLKPGTYSVTITDGVQCQFSFPFEIETGDRPEFFKAQLMGSEILPGAAFASVQIDSPQPQTVQFKIFDNRSRQIFQQVIVAETGKTIQYFQTPAEDGNYLIQILGQRGGVASLRFTVR